jgi:hypothetical protein
MHQVVKLKLLVILNNKCSKWLKKLQLQQWQEPVPLVHHQVLQPLKLAEEAGEGHHQLHLKNHKQLQHQLWLAVVLPVELVVQLHLQHQQLPQLHHPHLQLLQKRKLQRRLSKLNNRQLHLRLNQLHQIKLHQQRLLVQRLCRQLKEVKKHQIEFQ